MCGINNRILCNITLRSGRKTHAINQARATYLRINNIFNFRNALPNLDSICQICRSIYPELSAYISNMCTSFEKKETLLDTTNPQLTHMFDNIEENRRKTIRILLYPGDRSEIDGLKVPGATHNMILQFNESKCDFIATEPHKNPPSFYQVSASEEVAILYTEALLIDACMCHYLAISDAALHNDDKQLISQEKVQFIREIANKNNLNFLTVAAKKLVKYVAGVLQEDTPYISFLSIFTVAPADIFNDSTSISSYFEDYCNLWVAFQQWYFKKHKRVFSIDDYSNVVDRLLDRNIYHGQISPTESENKMRKCISEHKKGSIDKRLGWQNLYAMVILKHMPRNTDSREIFDSFFPNELHQAKFCLKRWGDVIHRNELLPKLELTPFLVITS